MPIYAFKRLPAPALIYLFILFQLLNNRADVHARQSQPPQSQQRTGRSYASGDLAKKPAKAAPQAPSPVTFADITTLSGINFKHAASQTSQKYLLESMGAGVAMLDYDNDSRLDLFFTNGARLDDPMPKNTAPDKRDPKYWNRLYHQKSDGAFEDVTERAGVKGEGYSMGVAVPIMTMTDGLIFTSLVTAQTFSITTTAMGLSQT